MLWNWAIRQIALEWSGIRQLGDWVMDLRAVRPKASGNGVIGHSALEWWGVRGSGKQ